MCQRTNFTSAYHGVKVGAFSVIVKLCVIFGNLRLKLYWPAPDCYLHSWLIKVSHLFIVAAVLCAAARPEPNIHHTPHVKHSNKLELDLQASSAMVLASESLYIKYHFYFLSSIRFSWWFKLKLSISSHYYHQKASGWWRWVCSPNWSSSSLLRWNRKLRLLLWFILLFLSSSSSPDDILRVKLKITAESPGCLVTRASSEGSHEGS